MPQIRVFIVGLVPKNMGDEAVLTVNLEAYGTNPTNPDLPAGLLQCETRVITVSTAMLYEIGNIGVNVLPYELSHDQFDTLEYDGELWTAVKRGLDILSYGDNTRRQLIMKLRQRGIDGELASEAAEYLFRHGLIDEKKILSRLVTLLAEKKKYGPSRIRAEASRHGIDRDIVDENLGELLSEIDFDGNLSELIEKKFDFDFADDRNYREKFIASMYRLGYNPSDTRSALRKMREE